MIKRGYARVLYHLFEGSKTLSQLARLTGYNKKDLKRIVKDLEDLGLVKVIKVGNSRIVIISNDAMCLKNIVIKELEHNNR